MHKTLEAFVSRLPSESLVNENSEAVLGLIKEVVGLSTGVTRPHKSTSPSGLSSPHNEDMSQGDGICAPIQELSDDCDSTRVQVERPEKTRLDEVNNFVQTIVGGSTKVCNEKAVIILAMLYTVTRRRGLVLHNNMQVSVIILAIVIQLASVSNHNKNVIHDAGILSPFLPCLSLAEADSDESMLLSTLCECFLGLGSDQLSEAAELFKQASENDSAKTMLLTALRRSKQPASIQFDLSDGGHCSIELPSLPRAFPPVSGYSFTAWVRIDHFDPECHTTLFGAFDATQKCFVLVYLEKDTHQLILQTSITSSRPSVRFKKARFRAEEWYHIALVHRPPKSSRLSQAALYINGRFVEEVHSQYPEAPPLLPEVRESNLPPQVTGSRRRPVQAFYGTPQDLASQPGGHKSESRWSLANSHLYDMCISLDIVAVQSAIGARYCGNFQDCIGAFLTYRASAELNRYNEAVYRDKSDKSEIVHMTQQRGNEILSESDLLISISASSMADVDGTFAKTLNIYSMLSDQTTHQYHALTRNGNSVIFNAARPAIKEAVSKAYGAAIITGSPVIHHAQPLDDATWQIGGCIPISVKILQSATTDEAIVTAVEILFECIEDNWRTSEAMEKGDGFGVLAILLREKLGLGSAMPQVGYQKYNPAARSPQQKDTLALRLLKIILKFVGYNFEHPERSLLINPMAYRILLVDFDTWRTVSVECQRLYFRQIADFIWKNNHQAFNMKRFNRNREYNQGVYGIFH